jgi:hypothetical protein
LEIVQHDIYHLATASDLWVGGFGDQDGLGSEIDPLKEALDQNSRPWLERG